MDKGASRNSFHLIPDHFIQQIKVPDQFKYSSPSNSGGLHLKVDSSIALFKKYYSHDYKVITRNTCTQQILAHPSNISLENPSNVDNFSKLSKRQIVLTIPRRGNAVKKENNIWPQILTTHTGLYFILKLLVIFTFKISIMFYQNKTFVENNL